MTIFITKRLESRDFFIVPGNLIVGNIIVVMAEVRVKLWVRLIMKHRRLMKITRSQLIVELRRAVMMLMTKLIYWWNQVHYWMTHWVPIIIIIIVIVTVVIVISKIELVLKMVIRVEVHGSAICEWNSRWNRPRLHSRHTGN